MKAYQAYSSHGHITASTPHEAASAFFARFPNARKCDIVEGESHGNFFTVAYGNRFSASGMPQSWKGVTKKTVADLPNKAKGE